MSSNNYFVYSFCLHYQFETDFITWYMCCQGYGGNLCKLPPRCWRFLMSQTTRLVDGSAVTPLFSWRLTWIENTRAATQTATMTT